MLHHRYSRCLLCRMFYDASLALVSLVESVRDVFKCMQLLCILKCLHVAKSLLQPCVGCYSRILSHLHDSDTFFKMCTGRLSGRCDSRIWKPAIPGSACSQEYNCPLRPITVSIVLCPKKCRCDSWKPKLIMHRSSSILNLESIKKACTRLMSTKLEVHNGTGGVCDCWQSLLDFLQVLHHHWEACAACRCKICGH